MPDYRISAPHFVCSISTGGHVGPTADEWVYATDPIVSYLRTWSMDRVRGYVQRKGWIIERLNDSSALARPPG